MIRYDSYYAANIARGIWEAKRNEELAARARIVTEKVEQRRTITWQHVYGHTGQHDNELADRAADAGRDGKIANQSTRWRTVPPEMQTPRAEIVEKCNRCGQEFPNHRRTGGIRWHKRHCTAADPGTEECRKCGVEIIKKDRPRHESVCRGSDIANRTCSKCGMVFAANPLGGLSRPMRTHEVFCKGAGSGQRTRCEFAETQAPASAKARAKTEPRSKATAKAKAAGRTATAKAKARVTTTAAKAKAKAKARTRAAAKPAAKRRAIGTTQRTAMRSRRPATN